MLKILACASAAALLVACSTINTKVVDPLITALSRINNTAAADLVVAENVAKAASPVDTDGYNCAAAAITASDQINVVMAAAKVPNAGVLTTAELASLFQPGSAQYNFIKQELTTGCAAKAQDVLGAAGVLAIGGAVGALAAGQLLPLAAAVPSMGLTGSIPCLEKSLVV